MRHPRSSARSLTVFTLAVAMLSASAVNAVAADRHAGVSNARAVAEPRLGAPQAKAKPKGNTPIVNATTSNSPNPAAELLFSGSKLADFPTNQSAPGAITQVPDPAGSGESVLKMTVSNKDVAPITPTENPRAQLLSPGIVNPGDEVWLQTKFMLSKDLPSVPGWMSLVSLYGAPYNGSSPWQVGVYDNEFRWQRNGNSDWDIPWRMPLIKGSWVTVLLHERFATDGWVEMWVNGQQINFFSSGGNNPNHHPQTTRLNMATVDSSNNGGPNAAKIMQYRQLGMFESGTVYFGALKVGESRASVGG